MATFISYQPRHSPPAFMANNIRASGPVGLADCSLWPQSRRAHKPSKLNGGVDLLGWVGAAQSHEATPESSTVQETPQGSEVDSIEECDEGVLDAGVSDSDDRGYCSDDSVLPSLEELLSQARGRSGTSVGLNFKSITASERPQPTNKRDDCSDTGSETRATPGIDAARGMFSGVNQGKSIRSRAILALGSMADVYIDNPIVFDESEDEHDSQRRAAAPSHDLNLDTASSVNRRGSSPLSIVPSVTDGAHSTQSSTGDYTSQNSADGEEGRKKHENSRFPRESGCANENLLVAARVKRYSCRPDIFTTFLPTMSRGSA